MSISDKKPLIQTRGLKKHYTLAGHKVLHALDGVDITVHEGEIFGVVGESGCGKSTLGRCVLRLTDITEGKVIFDDTDISNADRRTLKQYRRDMQMIFQNPYSSFDPKYKLGTSLREVGLVNGMDKQEIEKRLSELMEYIKLPPDMLHRSPSELSGGQLQRLAVARALMLRPRFIVADEPVSALDVSVQAQILNLLVDLRKQLNMTMLFISHEMTVVEHLCDRVAVMYLGRVVETAPTKDLFADLQHPYTKALISSIPKAHPDDKPDRVILKGEIPSAIDLPKGCRFAGRCPYAEDRCFESEPELCETTPGHFTACFRCGSK